MGELANRLGDIGQEMFRKLDDETIIHILNFLDTPRDLASTACVSRTWRRYVFEGNLWRGLCIKYFPEIGGFAQVAVTPQKGPVSCQCSSVNSLEEEYHVYSHLFCQLNARPCDRSCIIEALHASSTDNLPRESIAETLYPYPRYSDGDTPSYWSSKGQTNVDVPETLTYLLSSNLCVIYEIRIRPFQAYFQPDNPIYSSKFVRFRFGYSKAPHIDGDELNHHAMAEKPSYFEHEYFWTYESPKFVMAQEDTLQTFRLPRPILAIGDIFQVELLGRVQIQLADYKYYICISHISLHGRPIKGFDFLPLDMPTKYLLKFYRNYAIQEASFSNDNSMEEGGSSRWNSLAQRFIQLRNSSFIQRNRSVLDALLGNMAVSVFLGENDEESDDGDNERVF